MQSSNNGTEWVDNISINAKIQIPNSAFVDLANPTISEVRSWVDANLSDEEKLNSQLVLIETNQDFDNGILGSTLGESDYVWTLIQDKLTEIHRRSNHGNVWYVDANLPTERVAFAQKGNPDRPLKTIADINEYANLQDEDKVIFRKGVYTGTQDDILTKGNVVYHFESGAIIDLPGNWTRCFHISTDNENLIVTGNLVTNNMLTKDGVGDFNIEADQTGGINSTDLVGRGDIKVKLIKGKINGHSLNFKGVNSDCDINFTVNRYEGTYLVASAAQKSNIRIKGYCKEVIIINAGRGAFWRSINGDIGNSLDLRVDYMKYLGTPTIGSGFIHSSSGTSHFENSRIKISIGFLDMPIASNSTNSGLITTANGASYVELINSEISINIEDGSSGWNLFGSMNNISFRNSIIEFSGNFDIIQSSQSAALSNSNIPSDCTIIIDGNITTASDHIFYNTNASSSAQILVRNSTLKSNKGVINVDSDNLQITNSLLINDTSVDVIKKTGDVLIKSVASNSLIHDSLTVEVGEAITRHSSFQ